ncbi:MAG: hypothetical protein HWE27_05075 [Gammaproteobacteria bacterium]|nr:hypothetical protein [Gammaproteobacteria bacterium]
MVLIPAIKVAIFFYSKAIKYLSAIFTLEEANLGIGMLALHIIFLVIDSRHILKRLVALFTGKNLFKQIIQTNPVLVLQRVLMQIKNTEAY